LRSGVSGLRAWLVQRASAVYMLLFLVVMLGRFVLERPASYLAWRDWMLSPVVAIATTVFAAALLAHTWVGVRDVILDYARPASVRVLLLASLGFALVALGAWAVRILWR
jgi:succinate dehydrogenase / fumarate reductase, membrane anchor subunit